MTAQIITVKQEGGITAGLLGDVMKSIRKLGYVNRHIYIEVPRHRADPPRDLIEFQARASLYDDLLEMIDLRLGALQREEEREHSRGYQPKNPTETLLEFKAQLANMAQVNANSDGAAYDREGWPEDGSPERFALGSIRYSRGRTRYEDDRIILEP